ncbi:aldehyde dehydrogenase family protein [Glycomyces salinus]|uniref:aldehyde dehydrogenase family protein n=1 Tax=Glycomyces salinus TaxID=980294 RepID=UPI0018EBE115|nr:aldehyde dehydrogenase family protein [Glycomyces salinus]
MFEYAPAPESTRPDIKEHYGLFIDGKFVEAEDGASFTSVNPADGRALFTVAEAGRADVEAAVDAARRAFETVWGPMSGAERGKYLFRIARLLQERAREFAVAESIDNGKPIKETRDFDVPTAAQHFFYHAGWADKLDYAGLGADPRPLGVVGQVIPWNFPLLMLAWKIGPALACGNTVVLKPAETTPLTAVMFAELCAEAELPPGVVNILPGAGATGAALVHSPVDKVAFTGSTAVGREIAKAVAGTKKRLTLELGGKAANIVYDDAALDQAVEGVVNGIFFNQGHVCCAGSRLLVQESIAAEVLDRLKDRVSTLRIGDPLDKNTDVGAINSAEQLTRIQELTAAGTAEGAEPWQPECELPEQGFWFRPTVFTEVQQSMRIAREEIFGPVLSVLTFRTPDEAVKKANNTPYGLSAGVWTEKGSKILWTAERLRAGVVWANTFNQFDAASPFGGVKESGYGREGGRQGLEAYLDV